MSNELNDILRRLEGYSEKGWEVIYARKHDDGSWDLQIQPLEKAAEPKEATNDNN